MTSVRLYTILVVYYITGMMAQDPRTQTSGNEFDNVPINVQEGNADNPVCSLKKNFKCSHSQYRTIDGTCNNLQNPTWGATTSAFYRMIPSKYGDGVSTLPKATSGNELPNARLVSYKLFKDKKIISRKYTLVTMQWGQILTHDMSLSAGTNIIGFPPYICCLNGEIVPELRNSSACAPVMVPPDDPTFPPGSCIDLERSQTTKDFNCTGPDEPAEQLSVVTAYIDVSIIYGSRKEQAERIRAFVGGQLRTLERQGQRWPPQDLNVTFTCTVDSPDEPCYLTGDIRVNQNSQLSALHVILIREHNRVASALAEINPCWSDEKIYQEARRIVIAECQHINYYEYLPTLLGGDNMVKQKLIYPEADEFINDYDENVIPNVANEHASAAFRFFHSQIRGYLDLVAESRMKLGSARLSDWLNKPLRLEIGNSFDELIRGFTTEHMGGSDQYFDSEITKYLFRPGNKGKLGTDLRTQDIQRGRDHGLGGYVAARAACGLPVPDTFSDLTDYIPKKYVEKLEELYECVDDIDLTVGGSLEEPVDGTEVGPTFLCILLDQFSRTRRGDRFFYENNHDKKISFTPHQLKSIRNGASMAKMLCDNSGVEYMQEYAFEVISIWNPLKPCNSLPGIDLHLWKEKSS